MHHRSFYHIYLLIRLPYMVRRISVSYTKSKGFNDTL